jgi:hypothetical protein
MRIVWIAFAAILAVGVVGALLLRRTLDATNGQKPSLAPRGAQVLADRPLGTDPDQRVLTWRVGGHAEEPSSGLYGVTIVEGTRSLYSHRARRGAERVSVETGDFSNDGRPDVLVFDDLDGSGACGVYRGVVIAPGSVREVLTKPLCEDRGTIHLRAGGLLESVGMRKDPKTRYSPHCCYQLVRRTLSRWDGSRWVRAKSRISRLPPMHTYPGGHAPGGPA